MQICQPFNAKITNTSIKLYAWACVVCKRVLVWLGFPLKFKSKIPKLKWLSTQIQCSRFFFFRCNKTTTCADKVIGNWYDEDRFFFATNLRAHFALVFPRLWTAVLHATHFCGVYWLGDDEQGRTRTSDSGTRTTRRGTATVDAWCSCHMMVFHA